MQTHLAKDMIKRFASPVFDRLGIYDALLSRRVYARPGWLILMYHRVISQQHEDPFHLGMCVSRDFFVEQIQFIRRRFTPLTVSEAMCILRSGGTLPANAVSVTFDDGYRDFADLALPVLRHFDCPSTLFVTTGALETGQDYWWDRVIRLVAETRASELDISEVFPDQASHHVSLLPARRRSAIETLQEALWRLSAPRIEEAIARLETLLGTPRHNESLRLNADDIARLASVDNGDVEIAAHCITHTDLTRMSAANAFAELQNSAMRLRDLTGRRVDGLAYPGGRNNAAVRRLADAAGFSYAVGTERGLNREPFEPFNLLRVGMPDTAVADFKRCLGAAALTDHPESREAAT
jgi:peptidoglycan/xylan/chitin deacetylase (PgdA/CDA1 family)